MATCLGKKALLHYSIPHTATYEEESSLSLLSLRLSSSPPPLSSSAGTCNYLMPGRQVLSRGVRPGASWQLGMIRRILEFCHWSQRCSPRRPGRLVVTATIAALNLLTGGNSSRPRRLWNPKQRTLWGVERLSQAPGTWVGGTKLQQLFLTLLITFFFFYTLLLHCPYPTSCSSSLRTCCFFNKTIPATNWLCLHGHKYPSCDQVFKYLVFLVCACKHHVSDLRNPVLLLGELQKKYIDTPDREYWQLPTTWAAVASAKWQISTAKHGGSNENILLLNRQNLVLSVPFQPSL